MENKIYFIVFKIGSFFRNKSLWNSFNELKRTEKKSYIELQTLQNEKLRELLFFLKEYNPYYRHLFANNEIDLSSINVDTLSQLPSITKDELILYNSSLHSVFKFNKVFKCETSGTSGQVLKFKRNENWDSFNRASIMRGYSWFGINPWDFNIYFWGYNTKFLNKVGEIPYLWEDKKNILMVDNNSIDSYVSCITMLFEDHSKAKNISEHAREKASCFDWQIIKPTWLKILNNE